MRANSLFKQGTYAFSGVDPQNCLENRDVFIYLKGIPM